MTIKPFTVEIAQDKIDDLKRRLSETRWPESLETEGWSRGVPRQYLKGLASRWEKQYDWRETEAKLNEFPQFMAEIDGQQIHFIHVESAEASATPLLVNHGYPGSILEILPLIRSEEHTSE